MPRPKTDDGRLRRLLLLGLIREYIHDHGFPPTMAELVEATGIPRATLRWHLDSLSEQGYLKFSGEQKAMRTLRVTRTRKDDSRIE